MTSSVLKGSVWLFSGSVLTRALSFLSFLILIKALNVSDYGVLVLLMSLTTPVSVLSGLGLEDTVVTDTSRAIGEGNRGRARAILLDFFSFRIGMTIVILSIAAFALLLIQNGTTAQVRSYLFPVVFFIIANAASGLLSMILQVGKTYRAMAMSDVIEAVVRCVCLAALLLFHRLDISMAMYAYGIGKLAAVFTTAGSWTCTIRGLKKNTNEAHEGLWWLIRRHGKWEIVRNALAQLSSRFDIWSVGAFVNPESVGLLTVAKNILSAANNFFPLGRMMTPLIAESVKDPALVQNIVHRSVKYAMAYYVAISVLVLVVAYPVLQYFFHGYLASFVFIILLLPRNLLLPYALVQAPLMYAYREQKYMLALSSIGIVSSFTLLPLLTWKFGVYGVITEYFFSTLILYWMRGRRLRVCHNVASFSFRELFRIDAYDAELIRRITQRFLRIFRRTPEKPCDV